MAVIDETWEFDMDELYGGLVAHTPHAPDRVVFDWHFREAHPPSEEDCKLLASVPELLRENKRLRAQIVELKAVNDTWRSVSND